jgi:type I restriction enzyme S subunit
LRGKKGVADNGFLYYYLKNYIANIKKRSQGSVFDTINLNSFDLMEIDIPDFPTQQKIARVLSSLDSKIELNNCINTELEVLAKTLYNYWFVQFDYPNEKGKPYKTGGGKMVWNEELKRKIPEGWNCLILKDFLEFERGIEPGTANYFDSKESDEHIPFYKVGGMDNESKTWILKSSAGTSITVEDDILVSFDGSVGKIVIGMTGAFSTGIRRIYQKNGYFPKTYVYFVFQSEEIKKTIKKYATGSNILHAGSAIDVLTVPYNEKIVKLFNQKIENIFSKLLNIKKENQKLSELRDWLLPMLMNGQVKVN